MARDDPSFVNERTEEDGVTEYRAECGKCHYYGPWLPTKDLSASLLSLHRGRRTHRTNVASQYRFEA